MRPSSIRKMLSSSIAVMFLSTNLFGQTNPQNKPQSPKPSETPVTTTAAEVSSQIPMLQPSPSPSPQNTAAIVEITNLAA